MGDVVVPSWSRALLVGIIIFLPWKFFFASPGHLDSFGLLDSSDLKFLYFGAFCSMISSSIFLCYPLSSYENKKMLALAIYHHWYRLLFFYIFSIQPIQIYAWTCWNKDTFKNYLVYSYNTLRDTHYMKAIELGVIKCPPSKEPMLLNDIVLERTAYGLANQDHECGRTVMSIILIMAVVYLLTCNVLPMLLQSPKKKKHVQNNGYVHEYVSDDYEIHEFEPPPSTRGEKFNKD
jgi:hypothetical protein